MAQTFQGYLSQRWEDKRTPTPEYTLQLMKRFGFCRWHRIEKLHDTDAVHVIVCVKKNGVGLLNNRDNNIATATCDRKEDIESTLLMLQRDAFKKAFRHYPDARKGLWQLYLEDQKWAHRQAEISRYPKMKYLDYCEF